MIRVGYERTVIQAVVITITVIVGIAGITRAIGVRIQLIGITHKRAIIGTVVGAVTVIVGIAGIARAIGVGIQLI